MIVCLLLLILIWILPFKAISKVLEVLADLRSQLPKLAVCLTDIDMIKLGPTVLPYIPDIVRKGHLSKMGDAVELFQEAKQYVLPIMPELLKNLDLMMPTLQVLKPHFSKIAPHTQRLLPYMEVLVRNLQNFAPFVDEFLPLMEKEGWETMMIYLDDLSPWIGAMIPHMDKVTDNFEAFLPIVPIMAKYIDNFGPVIGEILPHTEAIIPFLPFVSIADLTGIFSSKIACQQLAKTVRFLPSFKKKKINLKYFSNDSLIFKKYYTIPKNIKFSVVIDDLKVVNRNRKSLVWFYKVEIIGSGFNIFRYSCLRSIFMRLRNDVKRASKDIASTTFISLDSQFPTFPSKSRFGRLLTETEATKRAHEIEVYLNTLISICNSSIQLFPEFNYFLTNLVISSLLVG